METARQSALKKLAGALPVANQRIASQQAATRDMQLQQAVASAPASTNAGTIQTTAASSAQNAGQQQVQNAQDILQQQGQVQQLGQQAAATAAQERIGSLEAGNREEQMNQEQKLAALDSKAKQEMVDSRKQFAQDELGRKFSNERQLADYAKLRSQSEDQWNDYVQRTEQLHARRGQMLQAAQNKLTQELESTSLILNQLKDQANRTDISAKEKRQAQKLYEEKLKQRNAIRQGQVELQQKLMKEQAEKANRSAMFQGMGTVAGAAAGTVLGGPMGGVAGAAIGGAVGSLLGGI